MKEKIDNKAIWNTASKAAIVFGIIPIAYSLLLMLIGKIKQPVYAVVLANLLTIILWAVKFAGCIILMKYFMRLLCSSYDGVTRKDTFRLGMFIALLSALIVGCYSLADVLIIRPDASVEQFNTIISQYSSMMDSNSRAALENIRENLPQVQFFSNLIYCFIYGTVLSAILSAKIPRKDIFADVEANPGQDGDNSETL